MGFSSIKIFNRSYNKIKNIKNTNPLKKTSLKAYELKDLEHHLETADLVINTTPTNFGVEQINIGYQKNNYGYDLVYNHKTNFLNLFMPSHQIKGLWMLFFQAIPCFELWFGVKPEIDEGLINLIFNYKFKF